MVGKFHENAPKGTNSNNKPKSSRSVTPVRGANLRAAALPYYNIYCNTLIVCVQQVG